MDEFRRQHEILTPGDLDGLDIDIVGAGALGGAILLCLSKMGCGITNRVRVTDFDRCEPHNVANQWFRSSHALLGQPKVLALAEMAAFTCDREIDAIEGRFSGREDRPLGPVVALAVDSLKERQRIWEGLRERTDVRLVLDARMGAEVLELFAVDMVEDDRAAYESSLDTDEEPYAEPCTRRAIFYTVLGGTAFVGSLLRAWSRGEPFPRHIVFDFRNFLIETSC